MKIDIQVLDKKIRRALLPVRIIFKGARFANNYQKSLEFQDSRYYPFYYYLGEQLKPQRVLQIGGQGGYVAFALSKGSDSVIKWCYHPDVSDNTITEFNSYVNISQEFGLVKFLPELKNFDLFDLVIISDLTKDVMPYLEEGFDQLKPEGLLVVDHMSVEAVNKSFISFCKTKNRKLINVDTRYGIGITER